MDIDRASLTFIRWLGLAGSIMLAVAGWLGGAMPHADLEATPASVARGAYGPIIIGLWLVGTAAQAYAWWSGRDRITSTREAAATALLWIAPFLFVPPIGSRDVYSYTCQGEMFLQGLDPYRQGVSALPCTWLETVAPIWRDTVTPYGPLFILLAGAAVAIGGSLVGTIVVFRLITLAAILAVAACLPALARRCGIPPQRALWVALAGPIVGAHLLAAPHNDAVMISLLVAGLFLVVRAQTRPALLLAAGALLGLAVAVKATAVIVIPFAILAAARPLLRSAALVGGAALAALLAVTFASGLGFGWVPAMRGSTSIVQFTSPPTAVGMTLTYAGQLIHPGFDAVPAVRALALVALAAVLLMLVIRALRAADREKSALQGAALGLAAFVVLSPVFHAWYALWALTLLAATTLRTNAFMLISIAAAFLVLPDGGGLPRFVKFPGAPLMTVFLVVLLVRYVRRRRAEAHPQPATAA
ncbi:polyprenol phosphomannose-dependent alpha 1,6 mannosyltransferase MptB [Actinoplanes sp. NEAU-A12]|uniref:Polyprenol phosphomannose-dependent alpha 1,6 mannosyltransferase MptB n=1 Tax=Actinoplanes sandaracinus TaxID=3045177 RepID=A0ABT6WKI5_9ACTN|nr:polyprenol phosphomannose-dependent alpha 1,6 mannosyltransferase MptB [Actinoplanes sandaracinus]MDI6100240.1 polyprenol phosphomannose-dependent alpha 1,6 mannosyltransferase MptB [Actinoplanes sandaracinus]